MNSRFEFDNAGLKDFLKLNDVGSYYITQGHTDSHGLLRLAHATLVELLISIKLHNNNQEGEQYMKLACTDLCTIVCIR